MVDLPFTVSTSQDDCWRYEGSAAAQFVLPISEEHHVRIPVSFGIRTSDDPRRESITRGNGVSKI